MSQCVFCGIAEGSVPATVVWRDDDVIAIRDANPQAPTHVLLIPREHIASAAEVTPAHDRLWARLLHAAQEVAEEEGHAESGYRLVSNVGDDGGQTVHHLHVHLLGGRRMTWPPG